MSNSDEYIHPFTGEVLSYEDLCHHSSKSGRRTVEVLDQTPVALPVDFRAPISMMEQMRAVVLQELGQAAAREGFETPEEADDFDDDDDPRTPWEYEFESNDLSAWAEHAAALEQALEVARAKLKGHTAPSEPVSSPSATPIPATPSNPSPSSSVADSTPILK